MKITRTLSILSIISCCIYIIAAFALAIFPTQVCILFGMKKYMGINPDYVAHSITPPLPDEAYTIDPVYSVSEIAAIALCLAPAVISAMLILLKKAKRLPLFLSWFSLFAFGISAALIKTAEEFTLSSNNLEAHNFSIINSIHSFIMLFGFCGAVLCVITAMHAKGNFNTRVLSIISIIFSIIYLVWKIGAFLLTETLNEYDKYYSIAAIVFVVLSALSYFGRINKRHSLLAAEIVSGFPLGLQLIFMFGTGDYYGYMSFNSQSNTISYIWLISGILCAVSSLKGVSNENPENS